MGSSNSVVKKSQSKALGNDIFKTAKTKFSTSSSDLVFHSAKMHFTSSSTDKFVSAKTQFDYESSDDEFKAEIERMKTVNEDIENQPLEQVETGTTTEDVEKNIKPSDQINAENTKLTDATEPAQDSQHNNTEMIENT